jgi:hypothetical protein
MKKGTRTIRAIVRMFGRFHSWEGDADGGVVTVSA